MDLTTESFARVPQITMCAVLCLLCTMPALAFAQPTFERYYGGVDMDVGFSVSQTSDGGYIITGLTGPSPNFDLYLLKTDSLGDVIWENTLGDSLGEVGECVLQTPDGGYIAVGYTESYGAGKFDIYVVATDSLGNLAWQKAYGDTLYDFGHSIAITHDSGYIVAGENRGHAYLLRIDSMGNTLWENIYTHGPADDAYSAQETEDGGYIVAGATYSFATQGDVYLFKTDSLGAVLWETSHGTSLQDVGYWVQQANDGGYAVVGATESPRGSVFDIFLVKTDSLGTVLWDATFGGRQDDRAYSLLQTSDGGYVICGRTCSFGAGGGDLSLLKTDSLGGAVWQRTYGGIGGEGGQSVCQTADGGFAAVGFTNSFGAGLNDVYLLKTDGDGLTSVQEDDSTSRLRQEQVVLFPNTPNPFSKTTIIRYSLSQTTRVTLSIHDITGRLVETLVAETQKPGIHEVRWDRKDNPSGVYFYRLRTGEFAETRKMVVVG